MGGARRRTPERVAFRFTDEDVWIPFGDPGVKTLRTGWFESTIGPAIARIKGIERTPL
ncbi:MAG: hypothetical protein RI958_794 [Actinomycetota bacterium]|jgi:hypothetical protein